MHDRSTGKRSENKWGLALGVCVGCLPVLFTASTALRDFSMFLILSSGFLGKWSPFCFFGQLAFRFAPSLSNCTSISRISHFTLQHQSDFLLCSALSQLFLYTEDAECVEWALVILRGGFFFPLSFWKFAHKAEFSTQDRLYGHTLLIC